MNPNIDLTNLPITSPMFIDKVYATLPIDTSDENKTKKIKKVFEEIKESDCLKKTSKPAYTYSLSGNDNTYGKDGDFLFQYGPKTNDQNNFLRFEFNPSKNQMGYVRKLIDSIVPDGYEHFIEYAKLNRMDFTFDVAGLSINDLLISYPRLGIQKVISKSKNLEYIKMGSQPKQIIIYDKCAHLKHLNKKITPSIHHTIPDYNITRIEVRHVLKLGYGFKEVHQQANPFEKLTLILYPSSCCKKGVDPAWHMFVDMCRQKGIGRTLGIYFNKKDASTYKAKLLDDGYSDWFNPHMIWAGINKAMSVILEPPNLGPFTNAVIGTEPQIEDE